MSADASFDTLLSRLRANDPEATAQVFHRYAHRLIGLASGRLDNLLRHKVGPEDVVQSAFRSFFFRTRAGQLDLDSWDGLWRVLVVITLRKCTNRREYFQAACRDVRREVASPAAPDDSGTGWEGVAHDPAPPEALELAETVERLLRCFGERERPILELALQGESAADISRQLDCSERKVYRVLERVKKELQAMQTGAVRLS